MHSCQTMRNNFVAISDKLSTGFLYTDRKSIVQFCQHSCLFVYIQVKQPIFSRCMSNNWWVCLSQFYLHSCLTVTHSFLYTLLNISVLFNSFKQSIIALFILDKQSNKFVFIFLSNRHGLFKFKPIVMFMFQSNKQP